MMFHSQCDICDSEKSFFWHPFCYGYMVPTDLAARYGPNQRNEQSFVMCDDCYRSFISWMNWRQEGIKPVKVEE